MNLDIFLGYLKIVLSFYEHFIIFFLFIANSSYLIILAFGYLNARKLHLRSNIHFDRLQLISKSLKPISLLIPAYNEDVTIEDSIFSMIRLNYPEYELIVVNDGSSDDTLQVLIEKLHLEKVQFTPPQIIPTKKIKAVYKSKEYPLVTVIDKENGGKADALNCGINFSTFPLICCVDSDSIFDEKGLLQVSIPFFEEPDEMIAVGGTIRVANNTDIKHGKVLDTRISWDYLSLIQIVEYLRAFLVGRMGWDYINANTIISGAFGLFKKKTVIEVGGYGRNTIGEDLELLLRMHNHCLKNKVPYKVKFLPDPVCWTEVPTDWKTLGNQRSRWQQGLAESLKSTKSMMFRPYSKVIGNIALPYLLFFELLAAPLELLGYIVTILGVSFGVIDTRLTILFLLVSVVYGWILTFGAVIIEELTFSKYHRFEEYLKLFVGTILEQFGFRQIHLYWRVRGIWRFLRGKSSWGKMKRTGFKKN